MALEAAMCPMTMYELGKCQKLGAETRSQMQSANAMNAMLMSKKSELENQLAVSRSVYLSACLYILLLMNLLLRKSSKTCLWTIAKPKAFLNTTFFAISSPFYLHQVTQIQKQKAEEQAAFNAKYAAEQKSQKEMFQIALAQANQEKAQVEAQKVSNNREVKMIPCDLIIPSIFFISFILSGSCVLNVRGKITPLHPVNKRNLS